MKEVLKNQFVKTGDTIFKCTEINIIDDNIKLEYARNFNAVPDDKTIDAELKKMNLEEFIDFCIRNKRYIIRDPKQQ